MMRDRLGAHPSAAAPLRTVGEGAQAAELLGWTDALVLPETVLLGCRILPAVAVDEQAHRRRVATGDGPQLDRDVLAMWEWPESAGIAPPTPVSLVGVLVCCPSSLRGLTIARSWRGFGAAAVFTGPGHVDLACQLEFHVPGVGLLTTATSGALHLAVGAAVGRQAPARRRVLDRWVEESLYAHALNAGNGLGGRSSCG